MKITIDCLEHTGSRPEVFFRYGRTEMFADLDPGVIKPVVVRGTADGFSESVEFNDYAGLQKAINEYCGESK